MKFKRSSGILLHPTSLPGPNGIGDIGPGAHAWVDFLSKSGCGLWQVLPLGPTGYADSPYQSFSAFAGNPYLISPQTLLEEGLLHPDDLVDQPDLPEDRVDYGRMIPWKLTLLDRAYERFQVLSSPFLKSAYSEFIEAQAHWLDDFALFMALKEAHDSAPWSTWETALRSRQKVALEKAKARLSDMIQRQNFRQFLFFRQWSSLRQHASREGIRLIGDIPIFVAHDSADVWANPELFYMKKNGMPKVVAGVPPDYFSPTGQLWGNPLYRWEIHTASGYQWWLDRIKATLGFVDIIRIDHFRGFAGYWEVPGKAKTAENGRWVPGPGVNFFQAILNSLGDLPILAEDLGVITPDVEAMREQFNLPGMKVLLFAFSVDPANPFLPHHYPANCVVYTGTHDNDTSLGWFQKASPDEQRFLRRYLNIRGESVSWEIIRTAWASVATFALAPLQDFLELDNTARMNYPGNPSGNWTWRMRGDALTEDLYERIRELNYLYSREKTPSLACSMS